jgi:hypothetical protein
MRILAIGDVTGRSGREAVENNLPVLRDKLSPDFVILSGDNAAHGFGITGKICRQFYNMGIDCITAGNHVWDQREIIAYIDGDPKLLRPLNYPQGTPGRGYLLHTLADGRKIMVVHLAGCTFMEALDDPFAAAMDIVSRHPLGRAAQSIVVDFHGEATSEKMAFAQYMDGRVSAVIGTHTHIPTADAHIMNGGSAYQTDLGMTGDYNSVIGMDREIPLKKFVRKLPGDRMFPAGGEGTFCGTFIVTNDKTGLAESIESVVTGPRLKNNIPEC